jgi:methyl-accepting chemotaxis protein
MDKEEVKSLSTSQPKSANDSWQGVDNLKAIINAAKQQLQQLLSDADCLQNNLNAFQKSLSIPATFSTQLLDLETFLKIGSDAFHFIASLGLFKPMLEPVAGILTNQVHEYEKINAAIPQLKTAVNDVSESVQLVIQHTSSTAVVKNAINSLNGWSKGADSLVRLIEAGNHSNPNAEQQKQLTKSIQTLNGRCDIVAQLVQNIINCATDISNSIKRINDSLLAYAEALKQVTQHDQLISDKALPTANKIAETLKTLDSIFNPLSELLEQLDYVNAPNTKEDANPALTPLTPLYEVAKSTGSSRSKTLVSLLNELEEKVLPLRQLNNDVNEATEKLNKDVVSCLSSQSKQLVSKLDELTLLLAAKYDCNYQNDKGKDVRSPNQFVDSKDVTPALSLIRSFN